MKLHSLTFGACIFFCLSPGFAHAQRNAPELRFSAGYAKIYLDEPGELAVGGSARFYLTERFGVQPEYFSVRGSRFEQRIFLPNLVFDLAKSSDRVVPYVIGAVGIVRDRDKSINYNNTKHMTGGGIGARFSLPRNFFFSTEVRLFTNTFPFVIGSVGYKFSGR